MKKKYLEIGKIVGTHGLKGELRVEPWCDSNGFFCRFRKLYDKNGQTMDVISSKPHKNIVIVRLKGTDTIEAAELLRGKILYIDRDDARLPEGTVFIQDLIGSRVVDADNGTEYGEITDVIKTGANDVYEVSRDGRVFLVPVIPDVVLEKDIDAGIVRIRPIKGIFDDED